MTTPKDGVGAVDDAQLLRDADRVIGLLLECLDFLSQAGATWQRDEAMKVRKAIAARGVKAVPAAEIECPECLGTGVSDNTDDCARCRGSGSIPAPGACEACNGTGLDPACREETCIACGGTGKDGVRVASIVQCEGCGEGVVPEDGCRRKRGHVRPPTCVAGRLGADGVDVPLVPSSEAEYQSWLPVGKHAPEKVYYMRDNHTFRALPLDVKGACEAIREEFADGESYGMLCTKRPGAAAPLHAGKELAEFLPRAREWLVAEFVARGVEGKTE